VINVLVVEDSAVVRDFLVHLLVADPDIRVVATARDGVEAIDAVARYRPDVVTMDIHMPRLDGIEATRRIMESCPTPIVIVSGTSDPREVATTFKATEAGALAVLARPDGPGSATHAAEAAALLNTVKLMSEIKVVRRWNRARRDAPPAPLTSGAKAGRVGLIAIGASTGGPPVLQALLGGLPAGFPVPLAVVQHMSPGFIPGFVGWLQQTTALPVHVARHAAPLLPGHIYVAPDDFQMEVARGGQVNLLRSPPENGLRPAVSALFRSAADVYAAATIGVLLTGMGADGARELKQLRELGAMTLAQDRASSVVHGMPGAAIALGGAVRVLPGEDMAAALIQLVAERGVGT
jgi:two-component system chemotaxis response regulator CheB